MYAWKDGEKNMEPQRKEQKEGFARKSTRLEIGKWCEGSTSLSFILMASP